eukprot:8563788-Ditylum_brightwellii.AAC.1
MLDCQMLLYGELKTCVREGSWAAQKAKEEQEEKELEGCLEGATAYTTGKLKRGKKTGAWLTVVLNQLNGTELSAEAFRNNMRLMYGYIPLHLPCKCNGY